MKNEERKKIMFFVQKGLDSFLDDIINELSNEYETRKIIVTKYKQIDEGMKWADICWFEWCDQLIIYASKLEIVREKKIICRLHSYEVFTNNINQVDWSNVDKLIFVAKHIRKIVLGKINIDNEKTGVIPNGIDVDKFNFKEREKGFNIAYVGYINYKKGPMLLLHTFKAIYNKDNRYKLYIAGKFQEERYVLYFQQIIKEMGLENNVFYQGWQSDISKWLQDKNYILCTSVLESQNMSVMQAMSRGIKPIIHNFVGSKEIYNKEYVWNSIDEAVNMIISNEYNSKEYREFIEKNFSLSLQIEKIKLMIDNLFGVDKDKTKLLIEEFNRNPDNIMNVETLFDYLIDIGDEKSYMEYLAQWFVRSNYNLDSRVKYYYGNMYRRMNSYTRFQHIKEEPYKEMENTGKKLLKEHYDKCSVNGKKSDIDMKKTRVILIMHGLDIKQSVNQFYYDYLNASKNNNFEYYVVSSLSKNEFYNVDESIKYLKSNKINYYIPSSSNIYNKLEELYKDIISINPHVVIFQSFYFAPINILLYPLVKQISKVTGRVVFQQAEKYFDDKLDFIVYYIDKDKSVKHKNMFKNVWPIKTDLIDKNLDIKTKLNIDKDNKIIVSIGREVKYKNTLFWNYIEKVISNIPNITFVFFGLNYKNFTNYIDKEFVDNKKVIFGGYNSNAISYLKSCDFYLNSFPTGGGMSLIEAYYAELPIITFDVDKECTSCSVSTALYYDTDKIFPKNGEIDELYDFTLRIIEDDDFKDFIQNKKKININDLKCEKFTEDLESYMDDLLLKHNHK